MNDAIFITYYNIPMVCEFKFTHAIPGNETDQAEPATVDIHKLGVASDRELHDISILLSPEQITEIEERVLTTYLG